MRAPPKDTITPRAGDILGFEGQMKWAEAMT